MLAEQPEARKKSTRAEPKIATGAISNGVSPKKQTQTDPPFGCQWWLVHQCIAGIDTALAGKQPVAPARMITVIVVAICTKHVIGAGGTTTAVHADLARPHILHLRGFRQRG